MHAATPFADSPVLVQVTGLSAGQRVLLNARWAAHDGVVWTSSTPLRAGADGAVSLSGVEGMRFLWTMRPSRPRLDFAPPPRGPSQVTLTLTDAARTLAHASLSRRVTPASVRARSLTVERDGVDGYLFVPPAQSSQPGVVVFGGSEGGDAMVDAAGLLAAHGYPTLALAYFKAPGLPSRLANIPLEYFARAIRLLSRQPHVDPGRVIAMGVSRGGEAALLVAATFPALVHGAIALVPNANVVWSPAHFGVAAWTYRGKAITPRPIALDRIRGPILAAGADGDNVWDSPLFVTEIQQRRADAPTHYFDSTVIYPLAGHDLGAAVPYLPQPVNQDFFGGTADGDAAAKVDLWGRILAYLAHFTPRPAS